MSASCTHVSALLHALVAMSPTEQFPHMSTDHDDTEDDLPCTSYPCQWKKPRSRKETNLKISDAKVQKHKYAKAKQRDLQPMEDFDPRPLKYKGTASSQMKEYLKKVRGKGLGVSVLFDPSIRYWRSEQQEKSTPQLPTSSRLQYSIDEFLKSLQMSEDEIRKVERDTNEQRNSSHWYNARRYRLTASRFGEVFHRKVDTRPDALVLRLLQQKQFFSPAIEWGIKQEPTAVAAYIQYQHDNGKSELTVASMGFTICQQYPFLGATPDGGVYDPTNVQHPFGLLEVKCPFIHKEHTPIEACSDSKFCCELNDGMIRLKNSHSYFCQIQGQMAICKRQWCDFVIYTTKGIAINRVHFNEEFWTSQLLPCLIEFYSKCIAPEIVSPIHVLGLPIRDLRNK